MGSRERILAMILSNGKTLKETHAIKSKKQANSRASLYAFHYSVGSESRAIDSEPLQTAWCPER